MGRLAAISERELNHATRYIIRAIDERFGGNQSLAARAFGCDPSTLNKIKNGSRKPVTIVSGVANALGVSVDTVLGRRPAPTASDSDSSLVQTAAKTTVQLTPRYPTREDAIERIAQDPEWHEYDRSEIERAADAFALALDSDDDPGFGFWFDGIRSQLKLWRRGKQRLGVRELEE